jgi:hypothetical protein
VINRFLTFSCAMIGALSPKISLPPVWSPCQWVLRTNLTGRSPAMVRRAARIFGASGAY